MIRLPPFLGMLGIETVHKHYPLKTASMCLFVFVCGRNILTCNSATVQQCAKVARQSFTGDAVQRVPLSSICNPDDFSTVPTVAGVHSEMVIFSSLEMITSPCHGHASYVSPHLQNDLCKLFWSFGQNVISFFLISFFPIFLFLSFYPARALRALGLLLADGTPTVGGGKTF